MKTYKICASKNFSDNIYTTKPLMLNQQLPIEGVDPPPITTLFRERQADAKLPFDQYFIEHEKIEHAPGRASNVSFQHYIHRYAVYAYQHRSSPLLLLSGKKKAISDLIRQNGLTLKIQSLFLDLNKVQKALDNVHMVWFRFYEGQFSSTSFHGQNVKHIVEQQDLFRKGRISTLSFTLKHEGRSHALMLSHDGTVVLQARYESIEDELKVLHTLHENFLKASIVSESLMQTQPQWKDELIDEFEEVFDPHELVEAGSPL